MEAFYKNRLYHHDTHPQKVNLSIGAYRTDEGEPWVLPAVEKAVNMVNSTPSNFEYLNVVGDEAFSRKATELLLGRNSLALREGRVFGVQCLSGTGSLYIGAQILRQVLSFSTVYISRPTWANHRNVFEAAGFETIREYRYIHACSKRLDFNGLLQDLKSAGISAKAVVVLHACAHNPTGMDPTHEEWKQIAEAVRDGQLFPFFDVAYQGFASGDPDTDAWPVRYFIDELGLEAMCAQSFSKNMGLYSECCSIMQKGRGEEACWIHVSCYGALFRRASWELGDCGQVCQCIAGSSLKDRSNHLLHMVKSSGERCSDCDSSALFARVKK